MTTSSKIALSALMASALAATSAHAGLIIGTISFGGNVNVYTGTTPTGGYATDFSTAHTLKIVDATVGSSPAPQGSFSTVAAGSAVTFNYSVININTGSPTLALPSPVTTPLWSVTSAGGSTFSFTLSSLTQGTLMQNPVTGVYDTLTLYGTGTLHDSNPADNLGDNGNGTWTATFNLAASAPNVSFSWSSSSAAAPAATPETGTSVMLLGLSLAALAGYAQFRKQVA